MASNKNKLPFFQKLIDEKHVLGKKVTYERLNKYLGKPIVKLIEHETLRVFKKDVLVQKLAQFALEGNISKIAKLFDIRPDLRSEILFTLAGLGAQDEMAVILRQHPEELLTYSHLRDISGAQFKRISLFQHCLWTKDIHFMANMMLDCLPNNQIGEQIRLELVRQHEEFKKHGVAYQINGEYKREHFFDLRPLMLAIQTYLKNYKNWTIAQRVKHWCTKVGQEQTLLPAYIRHHYTDSSYGIFGNHKPKLKRSLQLHNRPDLWVEGMTGLGSKFGINIGHWDRAYYAYSPSLVYCENNLELLNYFQRWTNDDLPVLIKRLHTPVHNQEDDLGLQNMDLRID